VAAFTAATAAAAAAATEPAAVPGPATGAEKAEKEPKGDGMGAVDFFILANIAFFADAWPTLLWPLRSLRGLVRKNKSTTT
jgi:hypothetical protein